jgi:2-iminobutanoate/2-iminopropanoate deaminase
MVIPVSAYAWAGDTLYVGGIISIEDDILLFPGDFKGQFTWVIGRLSKILAANSLDLSDVVMITVYLTDMTNFNILNMYYSQQMPQPWPPRKVIETKLTREGALVELVVVASRMKLK